MTVHLVWVTKYRYGVLRGQVGLRCRELIRQTCEAFDIKILRGVIARDHIHIFISYPPKLAVSDIVRRIKGRTGTKILKEFSWLRKQRYWGGHFWAIGYGAWSGGSITNEIIEEYIDNHGKGNNVKDDFNVL